MTKREKVLLQILVCVAVVGMLGVYILIPAIKKYIKLDKQRDETSELYTDMEMTLDMEGLDEGVANAKEISDTNFKFFNGRLNSYNINDIVNKMVVENNLNIVSLNIGKYAELDDSELIPVEASEEDSQYYSDSYSSEMEEIDRYLLGCDITFNVVGKYEDILNLLNDVNASSQCIIVKSFTYSETNTYTGVVEDPDMTYYAASIDMTLYGVKPQEDGGAGK